MKRRIDEWIRQHCQELPCGPAGRSSGNEVQRRTIERAIAEGIWPQRGPHEYVDVRTEALPLGGLSGLHGLTITGRRIPCVTALLVLASSPPRQVKESPHSRHEGDQGDTRDECGDAEIGSLSLCLEENARLVRDSS